MDPTFNGRKFEAVDSAETSPNLYDLFPSQLLREKKKQHPLTFTTCLPAPVEMPAPVKAITWRAARSISLHRFRWRNLI